jgi:hypothetical protein
LLLPPPEEKLEAENSFKMLATQLTVKWLSNTPPPHPPKKNINNKWEEVLK